MIDHLAFKRHLQKFGVYYYNRGAWNQEVAISYKHHAFAEGTAVFDIERGQSTESCLCSGRRIQLFRKTRGATSFTTKFNNTIPL